MSEPTPDPLTELQRSLVDQKRRHMGTTALPDHTDHTDEAWLDGYSKGIESVLAALRTSSHAVVEHVSQLVTGAFLGDIPTEPHEVTE